MNRSFGLNVPLLALAFACHVGLAKSAFCQGRLLRLENPDDFETLFEAVWPLPRETERYGLLALRRYYNGIIEPAPVWTPTGRDLQETYGRLLRASDEGEYVPTAKEAAALRYAENVLYKEPDITRRLKGISKRYLRPEVERHMQAQDQLLGTIGTGKNVNLSLLFGSVAEMVAGEGRIHRALRVQRESVETAALGLREDLLSRLDVSATQPLFYPAPDGWTMPTIWHELRLTGPEGKASCLVDVARIKIVRPWFDDSIWRTTKLKIRADSDVWQEYETLKKSTPDNNSFFETIVPAIPVELLLMGNKRLTGAWNAEAIGQLPKAIQLIGIEPMIVGVIARRTPPGPLPDTKHYRFSR